MFVEFGFEFCKKLIFYSNLKERYILIKMMEMNNINFLMKMDLLHLKNECKRLLIHVDLPIYQPLLKAMDDFWPQESNVCDYLIFVEQFQTMLYSRSGYSRSCASEKIYHLTKIFALLKKDEENVEGYHLTKSEKQLRKDVVNKSVSLLTKCLNNVSYNQIKKEDLIVISYFLNVDDFQDRTDAIVKILPKLLLSVANCGQFYLIWVIRLCYNGKANKIRDLVYPIDFSPLFFNEMYPHVSFHYDTIAPFLSCSIEEILKRLESLKKYDGVSWSFITFYLYIPTNLHQKFFYSYRPNKKSVPLTISEIVNFVNSHKITKIDS